MIQPYADKSYDACLGQAQSAFAPELRRHFREIIKHKARVLRHDLVHAAGCVFNGHEVCATVDCVHAAAATFEHEAHELGVTDVRVSVPRSLRPALGRWVGNA